LQTHNFYKVMAERVRGWSEAFEEYTKNLCRESIVVEAYLVGSRARGDHLPYSDYDIVVVVPDHVDKLEAAYRLRRIRKKSFPLDLIVLHISEKTEKLYTEMMRDSERIC